MSKRSTITLQQYYDAGYSHLQVKQINLGLESKVNVKLYTFKYYSPKQMEQIRLGLEAGLDVTYYARREMTWEQMEYVRLGLLAQKTQQEQLIYKKYKPLGFSDAQLKQLIYGLRDKVDITVFAERCYTARQMEQVRLGLVEGINILSYLDESNTWQEMRDLLNDVKTEKWVNRYEHQLAQ